MHKLTYNNMTFNLKYNLFSHNYLSIRLSIAMKYSFVNNINV